MTSRKYLLAIIVAVSLFTTNSALAVSVKQFYSLSVDKQFDFLVDTVQEMTEKLRAPLDAKGQKKSPALLKQQMDFAAFIVKQFNEEDKKQLRVNVARIDSVIYSGSLQDQSMTVESLVLSFFVNRYKEKLAADAASKQPVAKAN